MGTRADFYIGRGRDAEWLGSIAWDGYPEGIRPGVLVAGDEKTYREELSAFFSEREDRTVPEDGWPWPWDDSRTTDYSYALDGGKVWASCYGRAWFDPLREEPEHEDAKEEFPDMSARKNVTMGPRSGLIVLSRK